MKWLDKYWRLILLCSGLITATATAVTTFSTTDSVDKKDKAIIKYVDSRHNELKDDINEIRKDMREMRNYLVPKHLWRKGK